MEDKGDSMDKLIASLEVAPDGFLWWKGLKTSIRLVNGGFELFDKDPRRAARCGGSQIFVIPFEAVIQLIQAEQNLSNYVSKAIGKEGENV